MQPDLETFAKAVRKYRGNLSRVADAFGVTRTTVALWRNTNDEWRQVVADARLRTYDECLIAGEALALGIPEKDDNGNFIGWIEKPDGNMLRYYISALGRDDGFGDTLETITDKPLGEVAKNIKVQVVYNSAADLDLQEGREEESSE